ncbi:Glutathione S-transferase, N-terminal domain [Seminavis robusta]|uniref:Glutathione S-transferase, N-terminal domain n=1 Tax=Seminavis robusta TaxID=568900 RepID=A0A9N8E9H3_9STRA|nr:Glutathione S-transferase, N-terminal domain [Seminavis robusta]|eukprot:Sro820_g207270.1 Glutathione S-transferase, N-terminal domain (241) ;mRNA; f:32095-32817
MTTPYKLIIGNKNYSSWSLRAWLCLKLADVDFEEIRIPLFVPGYKGKLLEHSPAGRVPVLVAVVQNQEMSVWDSLAIMEFILETHPSTAVAWPQDKVARALARSISYEMHSGFLAIRDELPQNLKVRRQLMTENKLTALCKTQIDRVDEIWKTCRLSVAAEGPWLFGKDPCIADLMFIPVALRFVSYGIVEHISPESQQYIKTVTSHPLVQEWTQDATEEAEVLSFIDNLVPASESPLIL